MYHRGDVSSYGGVGHEVRARVISPLHSLHTSSHITNITVTITIAVTITMTIGIIVDQSVFLFDSTGTIIDNDIAIQSSYNIPGEGRMVVSYAHSAHCAAVLPTALIAITIVFVMVVEIGESQ